MSALFNENTKLSNTRLSVLKQLADGDFHSGEDIAQNLGLSRSAVFNHINALIDFGFDIFAVKGRGYQLADKVDLLAYSDVCQSFDKKQQDKVHIAGVIDSTNDFIKASLATCESGYVCLAEAQTAGKGRRGRQWISPFGKSIYCSMAWHFSEGYQSLGGLSLAVGCIVNQTLTQLGVTGCKLKWPNDVYFDDKKLAGILIEVEGQVGEDVSAVVGIGINYDLPNNVEDIDQAYTSVRDIGSTQLISRSLLAHQLIVNLWKGLETFSSEGLSAFYQSWSEQDLYKDKNINLLVGNKTIAGTCKGIDHSGAILLQVGDQIKPFFGGEISVRKA